MIRAFAIIGPRRRLGVGCAGWLAFLVVALSSCRRAAGMVVAWAITAVVVIGPYRRRTDDEKAVHGQDGGPCCLFQSAEHNRPPFRVTDSRGWLFAPYSVTATDRERSAPNSFVFAVRAFVSLVAPRPRFLKRHGTDAPSHLDPFLAADLGVGRPLLDVMVGKKCAERLLVYDLAAQQLAFGSWMMCREGCDPVRWNHRARGRPGMCRTESRL
jgi:hypothetical protein